LACTPQLVQLLLQKIFYRPVELELGTSIMDSRIVVDNCICLGNLQKSAHAEGAEMAHATRRRITVQQVSNKLTQVKWLAWSQQNRLVIYSDEDASISPNKNQIGIVSHIAEGNNILST
jgi:hypothetical protein